MESSRTSISQDTKQDDRLDEGSTESRPPLERIQTEHGEDLEKGPDSNQPAPVEHYDVYLVKWEGDSDLANPRNWKPWYKAFITFQLGMLALAGSLGSSIISPAGSAISKEFNISTEVTVLNVSLYVVSTLLTSHT